MRDIPNLIYLIWDIIAYFSLCKVQQTSLTDFYLIIFRNMRTSNDENELKETIMVSISSPCVLFLFDNREIAHTH